MTNTYSWSRFFFSSSSLCIFSRSSFSLSLPTEGLGLQGRPPALPPPPPPPLPRPRGWSPLPPLLPVPWPSALRPEDSRAPPRLLGAPVCLWSTGRISSPSSSLEDGSNMLLPRRQQAHSHSHSHSLTLFEKGEKSKVGAQMVSGFGGGRRWNDDHFAARYPPLFFKNQQTDEQMPKKYENPKRCHDNRCRRDFASL